MQCSDNIIMKLVSQFSNKILISKRSFRSSAILQSIPINLATGYGRLLSKLLYKTLFRMTFQFTAFSMQISNLIFFHR